jgi:hypothetical protein
VECPDSAIEEGVRTRQNTEEHERKNFTAENAKHAETPFFILPVVCGGGKRWASRALVIFVVEKFHAEPGRTRCEQMKEGI